MPVALHNSTLSTVTYCCAVVVARPYCLFVAAGRGFADKTTREEIFRKYDENGTGSLDRYVPVTHPGPWNVR